MSDAFEDRGTMCHPALLNRLVTCSRTRKQPHGQLMICFGLTLRYLLYDISIKFFNSVCSSAAFLGDTREHLIGRPSTIDSEWGEVSEVIEVSEVSSRDSTKHE
eukprot:GHVN01066252.1.p1 GENE.GHVN01066252.1~~GHVN01066252.1.p1  ORF type:complete len:104 (-),score=21.63 GHVN01066252.1:418-729(-)